MAKKEKPIEVAPKEETTMENPKKARKEAMLKLADYLKKHKLDPEKDWSKDPVHGKKLAKYYQTIRVAEEKICHQTDKLIKPEVHPKVKEIKSTPTIYSYPDIDGQPMSAQMKKKYRAKMRSLLKSNMDVKKAEVKALEFAQKWNNSDNPEEKVLRKKSPKTGKEATVELKTKKKEKEVHAKETKGVNGPAKKASKIPKKNVTKKIEED